MLQQRNQHEGYAQQGPSNYGMNRSESQPPPSSSRSPQTYRQAAVNPKPSGFEALEEAMKLPDSPPPSSPPQPASSVNQSSMLSKAVDFCVGLVPLTATLQRKSADVYDALGQRMHELGVRWTEPHGREYICCEYGYKGTRDYVAFLVQFVINGASKPTLPGADMWYTKVYISKDAGSGKKFREIGGLVLDAAKFEVRGNVRYDWIVTTWGLT